MVIIRWERQSARGDKSTAPLGSTTARFFDQKLGRNRTGIEIHAGMSDSLLTEGCIAVAGKDWLAMKAQIKKMMADNGGKAYLHVGPEGASITPTEKPPEAKKPPQLVPSPTQTAAAEKPAAPAPAPVLPPAQADKAPWKPEQQVAQNNDSAHHVNIHVKAPPGTTTNMKTEQKGNADIQLKTEYALYGGAIARFHKKHSRSPLTALFRRSSYWCSDTAATPR
jgi:hypothetical protein